MSRLAPGIAERTDMREFEGALDEEWCHIARPPHFGVAFCGECAGEPVTHPPGKPVNGMCVGCGKRSCPDCDRLEAEFYERRAA